MKFEKTTNPRTKIYMRMEQLTRKSKERRKKGKNEAWNEKIRKDEQKERTGKGLNVRTRKKKEGEKMNEIMNRAKWKKKYIKEKEKERNYVYTNKQANTVQLPMIWQDKRAWHNQWLWWKKKSNPVWTFIQS